MDTRPKSYVKPENLTEFGRYFEAICRLLGISHRRFAREADIPQATLWTWVADGKRPSPGSLETLFVAGRRYEEWRGEPWERDLTNLANHVTQTQKDVALADMVMLESEVQHNNNNNTHE